MLADTTYNSLSVDEVAASHVNADCIVHYGRASLTKLSRIPAYYVFPSEELDVAAAVDALAESRYFKAEEEDDDVETATKEKTTLVFLDQIYLDSSEQFKRALRERLNTYADSLHFASVPRTPEEPQQQQKDCSCGGGGEKIKSSASSSSACGTSSKPPPQGITTTTPLIAGYSWDFSLSSSLSSNCRFIWVGSPTAPALLQLQLTFNASPWLCLDPSTTGSTTEGLPLEVSRLLRRRYFLVEKARQANIIGILVGTLGAAGYGDALRKLKTAAEKAGKKTYTLLMGKPSPAKLANFPEIEVFVLVADPQGQILDSKEYLAPIITPHEAMLAFTADSEWVASEYRLDFDHIIDGGEVGKTKEQGEEEQCILGALVSQAQKALIVTPAIPGSQHLIEAKSAADYLVHKRSWQGVETPLIGSEKKEAHLAVAGQSGRAAVYSHESGGVSTAGS